MNPSPRTDEALFSDALSRPAGKRAAFLDGACGGDATLRARIDALLAAHEGTESLLRGSAPPRELLELEKPGDWIGLPAVLSAVGLAKVEGSAKAGRYKLLQQIGEGGCGIVWMAEQEEPVRRRVALKVIKLGMDTKAVVARFEAERQALAMMDHPNIAKVHDAGATETGRPFFVMELVRGIPITKYCDENHLNPTDRLELFIKVCQAVQHAHQKGIIHRDLKPSNILVTVNDGAPTPKIIDFGIAKATQGRLTDATVFTAFEQFIGTPVYMSPEQAEMSSLDIDTRSDIYSLGVLLYELLTGRPPFDPKKFAEAGVDQIRQQIREVEPPRPSARLSTLDDEERTTIAKLRNTASAELSLILRGDLDWIVMRCLEKDRTRRYDTANGLAADIQRYLRNEPVTARPPSTAYLLQKLMRRHKVGFVAGTFVAAAVVIGLVVSVWQRGLAVKARAEAEELVGRFLLEEFHDELAPTIPLKTIGKLAEQAVAYYDRLPVALVTRETARNRATALTRQGHALLSQADSHRWPAIIERAIADFEKLRAQGDIGEETTLGLALALCVRGKSKLTTWESGATDLARAVTLLRPLARAPGSSRRTKREFANVLLVSACFQTKELSLADCQEARRILADLGALDLSDVSATSAYGDITDSEAYLALRLGRIDDAERLVQESYSLGEKILARHPGDLRAMLVRAGAHEKFNLIEARRFHPGSALDHARQLARVSDDLLTSDPSDANAWYMRVLSREQISKALWAQGRVREAEEELRGVIALAGGAPHGAHGRWRILFFWLDLAAIAAQRDNRGAAEQTLAEAARVQNTLSDETKTGPSGRRYTEEIVEQSRRFVRLSFHEFAEVDRLAREALVRIETLARRSELSNGILIDIDGLRRAAWIDSAKAALRIGRLTDAERAARAAALGPQGDGTSANLETNRAFAEVLLALALARQGRGEEARTALAPALRVYRGLQKNGAEGLDFNRDLAFCLYVQAVAAADDPAGRAERGAALDEAAQLLDWLTDEAKALRDIRELIELIAAERGK